MAEPRRGGNHARRDGAESRARQRRAKEPRPRTGREGGGAAPVARSRPPSALTSRQLDIARLVAADLTNKQIAARLFLSERTVETHITNILNKLGLGSRLQLSRWMADLNEQR